MTGPHIPRGMEHRDWSGYDPDWTSLQRDRENNPTPPPVVADANLPFASLADEIRDTLHTCIDDLRVYARMLRDGGNSDPTVAEDIRVWGHRLLQSAERLDNEAGRKAVPDTQPRWILLTPDEAEIVAAIKDGTLGQFILPSRQKMNSSTIILEEGGKTTDQLQRGDAVMWRGQVYTVLDVALELESMHDPNNNLHTITWDEHPVGTSDTHTARAGVVWWMATDAPKA